MKYWAKLLCILSAAVLLLSFTACASGDEPGAGDNTSSDSTGQNGAAPDYNSLISALPANTSPSFVNFHTIDIEGNSVNQSLWADHKLTMVNIWATYCGPCLDEMPDLGRLHKEYAQKGVQVVGIVVDVQDQFGAISGSQVALAKEIIEQTGAAYPHLLPSNDLYYAKLREVYSVPETVFLDSHGNVVGSYIGSRPYDKWSAIIDTLLEEVPQ
jgi:thiol-disulfide isomerase/thioredoxin